MEGPAPRSTYPCCLSICPSLNSEPPLFPERELNHPKVFMSTWEGLKSKAEMGYFYSSIQRLFLFMLYSREPDRIRAQSGLPGDLPFLPSHGQLAHLRQPRYCCSVLAGFPLRGWCLERLVFLSPCLVRRSPLVTPLLSPYFSCLCSCHL